MRTEYFVIQSAFFLTFEGFGLRLFYMNEPDFTSILNAFSSPVLIAKPVRNGSKVVDFEIFFTNESFINNITAKITKCTKFSEFKNLLCQEVPWFDSGEKTLNSIIVPPIDYYSELSEAWYRVQFRSAKNDMVIVTLENITDKKIQEQKLHDTAFLDLLTGLPNKNCFNEEFQKELETAEFSVNKLGVLLINIDNMKNLNDSKGHHAGDSVILKAASILKQFPKRTVSAYRFGGDEFIVIIHNATSIDSITNTADTILEAFIMQNLSISGGISIYPDNSCHQDELLRFADIAMHSAKKDGKKQFQFFKPDMQRVFIQKLNIQNRMTQAVLSSSFKLFYQPQFDVKSCKLRGFEALIRWQDEQFGKIPPSVFIPLAEECGLIIPIGTWVLNTAFTTLKKWQKDYNFDGVISVNVSPIQLKQPEFIFDIQNLLKTYDLNPDFIEIEITEGIMIDNMDDAISKLKELKQMGFRISLDDFGTGYSSLSYLQMLPLDTLKIDKSFINDITSKNGIQANITNSIITMVSNMGLDTIAEGVEQDEQYDLLKKFNCNIIQGFLMGKPMSQERCEDYLSGNKKAILTMATDENDQN